MHYINQASLALSISGEIKLYTDGKEARKANYEAIDCGGNTAGPLTVKTQKTGENAKKFQIRNSL